MTEYSILFNAPMVRANRAGIKTQTRRTRGLGKINAAPDEWALMGEEAPGLFAFDQFTDANNDIAIRCPYGVAGDRLWVRETWADTNGESGPMVSYRAGGDRFLVDDSYPVDYSRYPNCKFSMWCGDLRRGAEDHSWRPSIHMPRWASRDTLEVISARPERLQCITENDVMAEGIRCIFHGREGWFYHHERTESHPHNWVSPLDAYRELWDSTSKDLPFAKNPFVWRIEYRRIA